MKNEEECEGKRELLDAGMSQLRRKEAFEGRKSVKERRKRRDE